MSQTNDKEPIWVKHLFLKIERLERLLTPTLSNEEVKPAFYTISSAAHKFRISRNTISKAIKNGELKAISKAIGKGGTRMHCHVFEQWYYSRHANSVPTDLHGSTQIVASDL